MLNDLTDMNKQAKQWSKANAKWEDVSKSNFKQVTTYRSRYDQRMRH